MREDSVPEFDFGSEATKKTSKDTILAELADLHGGNSPENEKPAKKEFNIFGKCGFMKRVKNRFLVNENIFIASNVR